MFEILRKSYLYEAFGKKIEYKQFTLLECLEFSHGLENNNYTIEEWVTKFIETNSTLNPKEIQTLILEGDFLRILLETAFKGYFSGRKSIGQGMPFEAFIAFLSEKLNTDPNSLIANYTLEQLIYYADGIIFNLNEQTKDGQRRNKINQQMKRLRQESKAEDDLAEIKAMEQKLNSK
ncbi:MAG TPA: hypothetical protein PLQ36_03190 [Candidatus Gracilibacteria bacterium]|nr:hypothetical protein [Candidatus Gracilibacteria bacterium]